MVPSTFTANCLRGAAGALNIAAPAIRTDVSKAAGCVAG
jgi:hypothetical protein